MGSDHVTLLQHTEVRWLSRGKVLTKNVLLRDKLNIFFTEHNFHLSDVLHDDEFLTQLTCLGFSPKWSESRITGTFLFTYPLQTLLWVCLFVYKPVNLTKLSRIDSVLWTIRESKVNTVEVVWLVWACIMWMVGCEWGWQREFLSQQGETHM